MSIQDLRETLRQYGEDLTDQRLHTRSGEVHERVAAVRRRRRTTVLATAAAVVVAVVASLVLPGTTGVRDLAHRPVAGHRVPTTLRSLGYTYELGRVVSGPASSPLPLRLSAADTPRLVSWAASASRGGVSLRGPRVTPTRSRTLDFGDFAVVPAGVPVTYRLWQSGGDTTGRVGLAVYRLGDQAPPGVSRDGITFRRRVNDDHLLAAAIGDTGAHAVTVRFQVPATPVRFAGLCTGAGEGAVDVDVAGRDVFSTGCGGGAFDPGATGATVRVAGLETASDRVIRPGDMVSATIRLTAAGGGPTPTPPGSRLGLGVYAVIGSGPAHRLAGWALPDRYEYAGHRWTFEHSYQSPPGQREAEVFVSATPYQHLVVTGVGHVAGRSSFHLLADGHTVGDGFAVQGVGDGGWGATYVVQPGDNPHLRYRARGDTGPGLRLFLAIYTRDD